VSCSHKFREGSAAVRSRRIGSVGNIARRSFSVLATSDPGRRVPPW
jgi:hypothetical protein